MKKRPKVGVVGVGWVGGILLRWLYENGWRRRRNLFLSDADPKKEMRDDLAAAEIIFICVPTPSKADGSCDISMVEDVVRKFAVSDKLLVIRSTVAPGTTELLSRRHNVAIAFNPEFLSEKNAWNDFVRPNRQIIGITQRTTHFDAGILLGILPDGKKMIISATEAEMVKYLSNVFGALKVTFANVGNIYCEALGANYENVRLGIASDARIGGAWLDVHHGHYRGFGGY